MNKFILLFLFSLFFFLGFAQKRELQATVSITPTFLPKSYNCFLIETRYKYRLKYAPIWFSWGIEYLNSSSYEAGINYRSIHLSGYSNGYDFKTRKIITPFLVNLGVGRDYKLYFGGGVYLGVNFFTKSTKYVDPTFFQFGNYFYTGLQLKIKKNILLNVEGKYIGDLSPSFNTPSYSSHFGTYLGMEGVSLGYIFINIGATYRLKEKKY